MKLIAFIQLAFCLQVAARTYSQTVTLQVRNAPLETVLSSIKGQTGYVFFYNYTLIEDAKPVTLQIRDMNVKDAIALVLKEQQIDFTIENKSVVLTAKALEKKDNAPPVGQAEITISGTVTSGQSKKPLAGATLTVKGTHHATTTNESGYFEIQAEPNQTIVVSYVGYEPFEFRARPGSALTIELKILESSLGDLVVIGYGSVKKSDLTGSVSAVKGSVATESGPASFEQGLQGRAAGVNVTSNSGLPGGGTTVRIRGIGSINSGNDPLYVVDGLPLGSGPNTVNFLNPDDIEQIQILKDASAAAIYGSQGANGVIIVTTKRGKVGAPQVSFNGYFGSKRLPKTWSPGNAAQFGETYLLAKKAAGATVNDIYDYYKPFYSALDNIDFTKNYASIQQGLYDQLQKAHPQTTEWMPAVFQTGIAQDYNVSMSGGTELVKYLTSASYYGEDGIIKTTGYDRFTFRFNGDYAISKKIKAGSNLTVVNSNRRGINPLLPNTQTGGLNFHSDNSILSQAYEIDPVSSIYRTAAEAAAAGGDPSNPFDLYAAPSYSSVTNPVAAIARTNVRYTQLQLMGNAFIDYTIIPSVVFRSNVGVNFASGQENSAIPSYYISGTDRNLLNSVKRVNDRSNSWDWINQLTYSKVYRKNSVSLMVAMDASHYTYQAVSVSNTNTPSNDPSLQYLHNATGTASADDNILQGSLLSYLGRLTYAYDDKYLLTATLRRDGSSSFSPGYQWGNFPSLAVGYKISEEPFFKHLNIPSINLLKFRGSWGQTGNSSVPAYSNVSLYDATSHVSYPFGPVTPYSGGGISNYPYQSLTQGVVLYQIGNAALTWEKSEQTDVGMDLALLNNKINVTADYFLRTTKKNLLQVPVPPNVGYAYALPYTNSGEIKNKGFEFTADYRNHIGPVRYDVGGNIAFISNEVVSLGYPDATYQHYGLRFSGIPYRTIAGHPMADFYGFKTAGIFQTQEEINNYKGKDGTLLQPNAKPGDIRFVNTNNDNALTDSDKVVLGSPTPHFTYGFNLSFSFKGIDVDMFFQGQQGNKILMYEKYFIYRAQGNFNTIKGLPDMAWHGPGTSNSEPRISADDPNDNFRMSDYYLKDGSYMRLKMFQVGYNFPASLCSRVKLSAIKIYASAENLLTFTHYPGIDPELASTNIQNMGLSSFEYPQPKTVRVGVRVGF